MVNFHKFFSYFPEKIDVLHLRSVLPPELHLSLSDIDNMENIGSGSFGKIYKVRSLTKWYLFPIFCIHDSSTYLYSYKLFSFENIVYHEIMMRNYLIFRENMKTKLLLWRDTELTCPMVKVTLKCSAVRCLFLGLLTPLTLLSLLVLVYRTQV